MLLEHANISVLDIDVMTDFLLKVFPEFHIRGESPPDHPGRRWRHVGNDKQYIALEAAHPESEDRREPYGSAPGLNHLGMVVDDLPALEARLRKLGLEPNLIVESEPERRRLYYYDPEGNDWEFVQYLTDDVADRNRYD